MAWPKWLPKITIGKETLRITVHGDVIPEGTVFLKCQLCKSAIPRDDFQGHGDWHTTIQYVNVRSVGELLK